MISSPTRGSCPLSSAARQRPRRISGSRIESMPREHRIGQIGDGPHRLGPNRRLRIRPGDGHQRLDGLVALHPGQYPDRVQPAARADATGRKRIGKSPGPFLGLTLDDRLGLATLEIASGIEPRQWVGRKRRRFLRVVAGMRNVVDSPAAAPGTLAVGIVGNHQRAVALHHHVGRLESVRIAFRPRREFQLLRRRKTASSSIQGITNERLSPLAEVRRPHPMFVADHHTPEQLHELVQAIPQKRLWRRAQAVVLAKQGRTAQDIADALGCSPKAVKNWVAQYNRGGDRGPPRAAPQRAPPAPGPAGIPPIDATPGRPASPRGRRLHPPGADVRRIIEQEFGVLMSLQSVYDLLQRLGYSSLMPRPQHEDANPEVQEFFKEIVVEQIDAIAAAAPGPGGTGLLRGRGAVRHAGDDHAGLGPRRDRGRGRCGRTGASGCTC